MNNRTLKRPMFRMGGSTNEGITSGLGRRKYQVGAFGDILSEQMEARQKYEKEYDVNQPQDQTPFSPGTLSSALANFSLNLAAQPGGDLMGAIGRAGSPALQNYQTARANQQLREQANKTKRFDSSYDSAVSIQEAQIEAEGDTGGNMAVELQKVRELEKIIPKIYDIESQLTDESLTPEARQDLEIKLEVLKTSRNNLSKNNPITAATLELFVKSSAGQNLYNSLADNAVKQDKIDGTGLYTGSEDPKLYPIIIAEIQKILGNFASGGRVGYNMGGDVMQEQIGMDIQTPQGNMAMEETIDESVSPQSENPISFDQLRARLPKEITDDIVNLMASSVEALEDFAMISTQQDVDQFNKKYSVNLVLPAEA